MTATFAPDAAIHPQARQDSRAPQPSEQQQYAQQQQQQQQGRMEESSC